MVINKKQGVRVLSEFAQLSIPFNFSWDILMEIVEKLEALDLSEQMYKWEDDRGMNYNFQCIEVEIAYNKCWCSIELELDPSIRLNKEWCNKQQELDYKESKKDAVSKALLQYCGLDTLAMVKVWERLNGLIS